MATVSQPWDVGRREWVVALLASLALALVAFLPYAAGYAAAPEGRRFLGFVLNVRDQNTYFMWMAQVARGDLALRNLYTSVPHEGAMLNLFFIAAGLPARYGLLSLDACYQAARLASSVALGLSLYGFVALFWPDARRRRLAWCVVLVAAGGGFAWQLAAVAQGTAGAAVAADDLLRRPVDLWVPEGFPFFSALVMPHFAMAIALFLGALRLAARGLLGDRLAVTAAAGACLALLSFVHPYDVIVLSVVAGATAVLASAAGAGRRPFAHVGLLALLGSPPVLYNYLILTGNPGMRAWLVQNVSASPPPLSYAVGFGALLLPAAAWGVSFFSSRDRAAWRGPWAVVAAWLVAVPPLLYAPVAFQRRLVIGFSVPVAVAGLAAVLAWVEGGTPGLPRARRRVAAALFLVLGAFTSAFHYANAFRRARDVRGENFADAAVVEALQAVGGAGGSGTVLGAFETGNLAPRYTGLAVVVGSRGQTADFDRTMAETGAFFAGGLAGASRAAFLDRHRVEFVLLGPAERALGAGRGLAPPSAIEGFIPWWRSAGGEVLVFRRASVVTVLGQRTSR